MGWLNWRVLWVACGALAWFDQWRACKGMGSNTTLISPTSWYPFFSFISLISPTCWYPFFSFISQI